jgi:hypothetical protein
MQMFPQTAREAKAAFAAFRRYDLETRTAPPRALLNVTELVFELAYWDSEPHAQIFEGVLGRGQPPRESLPHGLDRCKVFDVAHLTQRLA